MAYLALDLGAGSGRAIVGFIENGKVRLEEVHRFENNPVTIGSTIYWNVLSLFYNIKQGIRIAVKKGYNLKGIAVDTWGVDFGLIDSKGNLIANPVTYRDVRTQGMMDKAYKHVSKKQLYQISGIQQMEINSIFQLLSLKENNDPCLPIADKLLFTPDLINYFLTGVMYNEYTIASTSGLLNAKTKKWEKSLFNDLNLPYSLFTNIIFPGSVVGNLLPNIQEKTGAVNVKVFAIGSHDTASAIAAIPAGEENWAFLSSGTWSLLGKEINEPILTEEAMNNDFTNEGGVNNKILFMRNITGLWLLQRIMDEWEKKEGRADSYEYLLLEAGKAVPFKCIVNSDDTMFGNPISMEDAIVNYCTKTKQAVPTTKGEFVRCIIESLAIKYHFVLNKLQNCTGEKVDKLYIVGGGSLNNLLNQFSANASGIPVVTGLTESTALGNIIQQAIANNEIENLEEARDIIRNSFVFKTHLPENIKEWKEVSERVKHLF